MNGGITCKKWEEQTDSEKIETLRSKLREMNYLTNRIYKLEEQIRLMKKHDHANGKVVIPSEDIREDYSQGIGYTLDLLN